jgi:hypothetical protein
VSSKPPKILDPLRARVRRFQFIMGLGFLALVIGSVFTGSFVLRLHNRAQDLPFLLYLPLIVLLSNIWVLGVLPLLSYGAARVLELRPMSTAVGAVVTGQVFVLAVRSASGGLESLWSGWLSFLLQAAALAGGVVLTYRSVVQGRNAAAQSASKAQAQAEAKKDEYLEFLREAERGAEKSAQREAERAAAAVSTAASPVPAEAPVAAPAPVSTASTEAPTEAPATAPVAPSAAPAEVPTARDSAPAEVPTAQDSAEPKASTGS